MKLIPITARWRALLGIALIVALVFIVVWSLIEPHTLRVVDSDFTSPDLPPAFDGTRVVYVSDIHAGRFLSRAQVAQVVDRIAGLRPDLILLGGDYVGGRADGAQKFYPEAGRLSAPLGVFAVIGNHDVMEGRTTAAAGLAASGIELLENSSARVKREGETIVIAGMDDGAGYPDLSATAKGVRAEEFAILLSHGPDPLVEQLPANPGIFDLALSGHTHGGQLTFFGLWAPLVNSKYGNRYRAGWSTIAGTPMLVSTGIGTVYLPVRLGVPPEIRVITLRRGDKRDPR